MNNYSKVGVFGICCLAVTGVVFLVSRTVNGSRQKKAEADLVGKARDYADQRVREMLMKNLDESDPRRHSIDLIERAISALRAGGFVAAAHCEEGRLECWLWPVESCREWGVAGAIRNLGHYCGWNRDACQELACLYGMVLVDAPETVVGWSPALPVKQPEEVKA